MGSDRCHQHSLPGTLVFRFLFAGENDSETAFSIPEDEKRKWELRKLYYAEKIHFDLHGCYTADIDVLKAILKEYAPNEKNTSVREGLAYTVEATSHGFELSCPAEEDGHEIVLFGNGKVKKSEYRRKIKQDFKNVRRKAHLSKNGNETSASFPFFSSILITLPRFYGGLLP